MSGLRRHCRLVLDGRKIDIVTSARDIAEAEKLEIDGDKMPMLATLGIIHCACKRLKVTGVPSDFLTFVDLLDEFDDLEADEEGDNTEGKSIRAVP